MQRLDVLQITVERLRRLRPPFAATHWGRDQFIHAAEEGKRRWEEAERLFDAQWPMFADAVAVICPSFGLESRFAEVANATVIPSRRNVDNRIATWFMNWARCPMTAGYPNPYEPWIEIWENGGSFSVEHGQCVDIYNASGMPQGAIAVRRA